VEDVGLLAEAARLDATAGTALPGVLDPLAHADLLLDDLVGVEDRGIAGAAPDDPSGGLDQPVRRLGGDLNAGLGLKELELVQDLQDDVGDLVGAVRAVPLQAAQVDLGEVVVGAALLGGDAHLGGSRGVVDLDPEAGEQLLRPLPVQGALGQALLVEGSQVLVDMPRVHGIPAVEFGDGAQVAEPVGLEGLLEVPWRMGRDPPAGLGDLPQLRLPGRVRLLRGHLLRQGGVTLGEEDRRVARDVHGLQFLVLLGGVGVVQPVQPGPGLGDLGLEVEHAHPVDRAVQGGVPRSPLLHELSEQPRAVEILPLLGDLREGPIPHGSALPVGDDLLLINLDVLRVHHVAGHGPGVEDPQVLRGVAVQLREGGDHPGPIPSLTHDQLLRADVDPLLLAEILEVQRPHHRHRVLARVLPIELGGQKGSLDRDGGLGLKTFLPKPCDPFVHLSHPPMRTGSPYRSIRPAEARS